MNSELIVKNAEGKDQTISVVDIILDNETGKKYLFYNMAGSKDLYATILIESEASYILEAISDDEEWNLVEEILKNQVLLEGGASE